MLVVVEHRGRLLPSTTLRAVEEESVPCQTLMGDKEFFTRRGDVIQVRLTTQRCVGEHVSLNWLLTHSHGWLDEVRWRWA